MTQYVPMAQRKPTTRRATTAKSPSVGRTRSTSARPHRDAGMARTRARSIGHAGYAAPTHRKRDAVSRNSRGGMHAGMLAGSKPRGASGRPSVALDPLKEQVKVPLGEDSHLLLTRRQLLVGAAGIGAVALAAVGAGAVSDAQKKNAAVTTLEVAEDNVFTLADCSDEEAPLGLMGEYQLPYGTLVWANSDTYAACLLPTEGATPLTNVGILNLNAGTYAVVLEAPVTEERGFEIYDVRCNENGVVWLEANCLSGQWRVYHATHNGDSLAAPALADQGDSRYDLPFLAVAGNRAWWQVLPNANGSASAEPSLLKSAAFGAQENRTEWESNGRMSTPPYSTRDGIVITPRVDTEGVYYQLTLLDAKSGTMQDSMTLPASMKPLEAGYVNGRFTFSFDAIYSYGEGIANLGTYAPVDAGAQSNAPWFRFDRAPSAPPCWAAGSLIVKSTRSVAGADLSNRTLFTLPCPDGCDSFGEYLASTGDANTVVTYVGMGSAEEKHTLVRVWSA